MKRSHSQCVDTVSQGPVRTSTPARSASSGGVPAVPRCAEETAYYLHGKLPRLALIAKGVRIPAGNWLRVAAGFLPPWEAEAFVRDLFPALATGHLPFVALLTVSDVEQFEQDLEDEQKTGLVA